MVGPCYVVYLTRLLQANRIASEAYRYVVPDE